MVVREQVNSKSRERERENREKAPIGQYKAYLKMASNGNDCLVTNKT